MWALASARAAGISIRKLAAAGGRAVAVAVDVVDDAMGGMKKVIGKLVEINTPELSQHATYLRRLFSETAPEAPLLLRLSPRSGQGMKVDMQRLDDLTFFIRNRPREPRPGP